MDSALNGVGFDSSTTIPRDFCLDGVYTTAPSRLHKARAGVFSLDEKQFQHFRDSPAASQRSSAASPVTGIVISKKVLKNQTSVLVLLQNDGAFKVWKTSKGNKIEF